MAQRAKAGSPCKARSNSVAGRFGHFGSPEGRKQNSPGASARLQPWEHVPPGGIALQGRPSVGHKVSLRISSARRSARRVFVEKDSVDNQVRKGTEPSHVTTHLYVVINAIRTPLQGDFYGRVVPRAEALGCFLFARRALGTLTRKCPNCRRHFVPGYDRCCLYGTRWQTFRNRL